MSGARFITFEGGEGVGKSTQARMLSSALEARGIAVLLTREPGGTRGAEAIRELLLDTRFDWQANAEALLFAAARSDHVGRAIGPALDAGTWVICDRFIDSSRAYQGGGDDLSDDAILSLHTIGSYALMPDMTFLLSADDADVQQRLAARDGDTADRIGGKPAEYHTKVADRFRRLAAIDTERFVQIDASGSAAQVHDRIVRAMAPMLGEGG